MRHLTTLTIKEFQMNEIEKKRAQIEILKYLMDHLCITEMSEIGRKATNRIIIQLQNEMKEANESGN